MRGHWLALGLVVGCSVGCAAGSNGQPGGNGPGSGSSGGGPTGDDSGVGQFGGPDGGGTSCSSDLQNVVDGNGNVVQKCAPGLGCSNGQCIQACDAAAQNQGNVGCDFVVSTPLMDREISQPCFAVFLANNWSGNASVTVTYGGSMLDATTFARVPNGTADPTSWPALGASGLAEGQVAVLFLSHDPASMNGGNALGCPVAPAVPQATQTLDSAAIAQAFHIVTSLPVSAYDIMPFGGAKSYLPGASMLLPTSAWGKNYVAANPTIPHGPNPIDGVLGGPLFMQIVAAQDHTTIQIRPKVVLWGKNGLPDVLPNTVGTFTLDAGQYLQWTDFWVDMPGSPIVSDKPVAFIGGSGELCLTSQTSPMGGGCDAAHQQIPPVSALGFDYAIAPYTTRRADMQPESIPYRLVGAVDGTILTYDPPIAGAPATLDHGAYVDFEAVGPFRLHSQDQNHPFYVVQSMPGGYVTSGSRPGVSPGFPNPGLGDEDWVNVLPPEQYQSSYVFFTDPTYATTNLVLTRVRDKSGFHDVSVDCIGPVTGWTAMGSSGDFQFTNVDLSRGGTSGCPNGGHTAKSDGRFGLVVWGLDNWASYAYPAGGSVMPINHVVVPTTQ